jgi:uncharacterized repeat protein (TIGR03843 family)
MNKEKILNTLKNGRLSLDGRFIYGSNYTFMVTCQGPDGVWKAVYKPMEGEQPLWDFPDQTLGKREVAAYRVSEALGWNLVPPTVFRTQGTPMGAGSLQVFIEHNPEYHYFNFKEEDKQQIPQVILFDLLINNADRKAGHLLFDPQGDLWLIDHGLCFHAEEKLRTVIWDLAGEPISEELLREVEDLLPSLDAGGFLYQDLVPLLRPIEITALQNRAKALLESGAFPLPPEDRRAYPWPLI